MSDLSRELLIGVLVDVSGSMRGSIGSSGTDAMNRLEAFNLAFEDLIRSAADFQKSKSSDIHENEVRMFAYGFGFNNPFSSFMGRQGPEVRDLLAPQGHGEVTVSAKDLSDNWERFSQNIRSMAFEMFGGTPMKSALKIAKGRIIRELEKHEGNSVLFILSDGEPTDGTDGEILAICEEIKHLNTTIVSCFVTNSDFAEPQRLYNRQIDSWSPAAKLMFSCASHIIPGSSFDIHLREYNWQYEEGSKLFSQINHSVTLGNFLNIVLSPLNDRKDDNSGLRNDGDNIDKLNHVVILVHGIRTSALWQSEVRKLLVESGFDVEPTNYGRFDLIRFLLPVPWFRNAAAAQVLRQIKIVSLNNKNAEISIIAHSFGTYVVSKLLNENFDLVINRVIFCGSVVRYGFQFENFQNRFRSPILNEVGSCDPFPALAESVTWGYGSAGTYGFKRPLVRDRWHNNAGHSYFLNRNFCKKFWVPFLKHGIIVNDDDNPDQPPFWVRFVSVFRIKWLFLFTAILYILYNIDYYNFYTILPRPAG